MRKFQVTRYLQRWKALIIAIAILGSAGVYWYGSTNQTYTASAVMSYKTNTEGEVVNPDGTPVDTSEIISAAVITDAIRDLDLDANVENIRSKCRITEIIPPEEEEKRKSALDHGEEYSYSPSAYTVSFTVGSDYTRDYARDVLDSILTNYFSFYCRKYLNQAALSNNAANVSSDKYDYIECAELLESAADDIIYYLNERAENYSGFRSAKTGYSFADLSEKYEDIRNNDLVGIHAFILNNKLVKDREVLLKNYENRKAKYQIQIYNETQHIDEAKAIIDKFGAKTLEENAINYSFGSGVGSNQGLITNDVEEMYMEHRDKVQTTYDRLINQYVNLQDERISDQISLSRCQEVLDTYSGVAANTDPSDKKAVWAAENIDKIAQELNELYDVILPTIDEFNEKNGADNLSMRSSISARENINLNIYLAIAVLFFLIVGCFVAIFCGRMGDFIDYLMYTDSKTGLPNRNRCDMVIEQYEVKPLPEEFACIVFKVDLRYADMPGFSRGDGDRILGKIGGFIKHIMENNAFVGYNNDGMFIAFVENSTAERAEVLVNQINELVENYNSSEAKYPIRCRAGIAETGRDNIYSARGLLRKAIGNAMKSEKES